MMVTEAQEKQRQRMAVAATQSEARSEIGRIIIQMFNNTNNLWASPAEIMDVCSAYDAKLVRNRVTHLLANHTLEVDKSGGMRNYKYRLANFTPELVGPTAPETVEPCVQFEAVTVQEIPAGTNGRKPKVVWSHEEQLVLAHEVATIREHQKFINLGTALEMAQRACLPPERHRIPINHVKSQAPWLVDMVDLIAANKSKEETKPTEPAPAPLTPADFTVGQLVDALLDKLSDRFKIGVLDILKSPEVRSMLHTNHPPPIARHNPSPQMSSEPAVKKERILIAGLLKPMHEQEVKQKYGNDFDLRFYHPDQSVHKLKTMAPNADRILLMATMISHKHEDSLKTTNCEYEKIRGNIGVLLDRLHEIKSEQPPLMSS